MILNLVQYKTKDTSYFFLISTNAKSLLKLNSISFLHIVLPSWKWLINLFNILGCYPPKPFKTFTDYFKSKGEYIENLKFFKNILII